MKRVKLFALISLLFIGLGHAWGAGIQLTSEAIKATSTSSPWNAYTGTNQKIVCNGETWIFDGTMHTQMSNVSNSYLQVGQKSGLVHTPTVAGSISQIIVNATGNNSGRYLQIEAPDGTHIGAAQLISATGTPTDYTFNISGSYSQLNIANHNQNGVYSTSNNAINIYSITVTYTSGSSGGVTYTNDFFQQAGTPAHPDRLCIPKPFVPN